MLVIALSTAPETASAQQRESVPIVSRPVVQPLPSRDALLLNAALSRLARNPRDVNALIDAGDAAGGMGDFEAAIGFYMRADQINGNNPRVKAGLARVHVQDGSPLTAIPLFEEAERAGADAAAIAADRGLAHDLVGDSEAAQRFYRVALARGTSDEVILRLAVSQAIMGDSRAAEATLMPLLHEQDKAAWRARAFSLAILGKTKEAVKITDTILPGELAEAIAPYLHYMPRLTAAQQAAAANLGRFPRASEIGRDNLHIARYTQPNAPDSALVPQGEPLDRSRSSSAAGVERESGRRGAQNEARSTVSRTAHGAPPEPRPARKSEPAVVTLPEFDRMATTPSGTTPLPGFDLSSASRRNASVARDNAEATQVGSAAPGVAIEAPRQRVSLAEAFGDLGSPGTVIPVGGAVDVTRIEAAKPKPQRKLDPAAETQKPPLPSHPSRIWVQLGIGQNTSALAYDWRRLTRTAGDTFSGRRAYVGEMGRTNRMLTGPFNSLKEAQTFVSDLQEAGIDGPYVWTSPAGQVIDALPDR